MDSAIAYNRSNGGVAFVFVKNFGCEARLMVCECPKFFASAKLHTPGQIAKTQNPSAKDAPQNKLQKLAVSNFLSLPSTPTSHNLATQTPPHKSAHCSIANHPSYLIFAAKNPQSDEICSKQTGSFSRTRQTAI